MEWMAANPSLWAVAMLALTRFDICSAEGCSINLSKASEAVSDTIPVGSFWLFLQIFPPAGSGVSLEMPASFKASELHQRL